MEIPDLILSRLVDGASFRKLMGIEYGRAEEYLFRKKKKTNFTEVCTRKYLFGFQKRWNLFKDMWSDCWALFSLIVRRMKWMPSNCRLFFSL